MAQYRAYIIGSDGEFPNSLSLECADDEVAVNRAKQLVAAIISSFGSTPEK
jgi:hypothetical protein